GAKCAIRTSHFVIPLVRVGKRRYAVQQLLLVAREPDTMSEWYYARNNQRLGPVSTEQLKQLASSGQLSPNDLVWKDAMANWMAASTIPNLFPSPAPAPAPAPAPLPAPAPPPPGPGAAGTMTPASHGGPEDVIPLDVGESFRRGGGGGDGGDMGALLQQI